MKLQLYCKIEKAIKLVVLLYHLGIFLASTILRVLETALRMVRHGRLYWGDFLLPGRGIGHGMNIGKY